jgi:hypothetical protein
MYGLNVGGSAIQSLVDPDAQKIKLNFMPVHVAGLAGSSFIVAPLFVRPGNLAQ